MRKDVNINISFTVSDVVDALTQKLVNAGKIPVSYYPVGINFYPIKHGKGEELGKQLLLVVTYKDKFSTLSDEKEVIIEA